MGSGVTSIRGDDGEVERPEVAVEREHVIDVPFAREDRRRVISKRNLLVVVVRKLTGRGLEGGSTNREDIEAFGLSNCSQGPDSVVVAEFVEASVASSERMACVV